MKGPSPGAAKWRINGVGAEKRRRKGEKREKSWTCAERSGQDREMDSEKRVGKVGTRTRKVDSEVYTVRRDLINPPELLLEDVSSLTPLIRQDALCSPTTLCSRGRSKFQVMACSDRRKVLSFLYHHQSIS